MQELGAFKNFLLLYLSNVMVDNEAHSSSDFMHFNILIHLLLQDTLGVILRTDNARSKPCGVFGSFGWSGEAVDEIEQRLKDAGFSFAFPTIRCKFKVIS